MAKWQKLKESVEHLKMGRSALYKPAHKGKIPARKAKTSLETPGQVRTLEAPRQGEGQPSNTVMAVL